MRRNIAVIACDNFSIGEWQCDDPGVEWLNRDITDADWDTTLAGKGVNGVIHCAAHPGGLSLADPVLDVKVNALGSMKLFDWCARNNAKIVYLSSSAVYGPIDQFMQRAKLPARTTLEFLLREKT
jgi:UDP-glucose 4-epimerase